MKTLNAFSHVNAETIEKAANILAKGQASVISGGTDLIGTIRERVLREDQYPGTVVNLKTIPDMDYIKEEGGVLKIGALAKLEDIATNEIVLSKYTALAQAAGKTASHHLREMGTIGGNICQYNRCWYFRKPENRFDCVRKGGSMCYAMAGDNRYHSIFGAVKACLAVNPSDTAPALVALNASIKTSKKIIAAEDFWAVSIPGSTVLDSDEIVVEIQIPAPADGVKSAFVKFAIRSSIDFPIVNCAAAIGGEDARICLNAVYNMPYRATAAEEIVKGQAITEELAESAGAEAISKAIVMPANGTNPGTKWKVQVAKAMVKRAVLACA